MLQKFKSANVDWLSAQELQDGSDTVNRWVNGPKRFWRFRNYLCHIQLNMVVTTTVSTVFVWISGLDLFEITFSNVNLNAPCHQLEYTQAGSIFHSSYLVLSKSCGRHFYRLWSVRIMVMKTVRKVSTCRHFAGVCKIVSNLFSFLIASPFYPLNLGLNQILRLK